MAASLPFTTRTLLRPNLPIIPHLCGRPAHSRTFSHTHIRHASLLRRPQRPYTFTQLITLSDGSTIMQRTTSPVPVYKSIKDTRNHPLWNPSSNKLRNVEEDEAGRLKKFRKKFGRGWDGGIGGEDEDGTDGVMEGEDEEADLGDLMSGFVSKEEVARREKEMTGESGKRKREKK